MDRTGFGHGISYPLFKLVLLVCKEQSYWQADGFPDYLWSMACPRYKHVHSHCQMNNAKVPERDQNLSFRVILAETSILYLLL